MEIIIVEDFDRVENLFNTVKIIRYQRDIPVLWKLNYDYLDALCYYMHICDHSTLLERKFLEASIDHTSGDCFCVGELGRYPLFRSH